MSNAAKLLEKLRDPLVSLPLYGSVLDQSSGNLIRYNPMAVTDKMQATIMHYASKPPLTEHGQTKWLCVLKSRQTGASLCTELAMYPKAAYTIGWDHVCLADNDDRANYLHQRVHLNHEYWPEEVRAETIPNRERRQLTFKSTVGGRMRTLSAASAATGIGQSIDSLHSSELAFWPNAGETMTLLLPAMINRDKALMVQECTPAPSDAPSVDWWRDTTRDAKMGKGRWLYAFFPFWDGKLNRRAWTKGEVPTNEELRLLEDYGPKGLTLENLAFRRFMMETDREMRVNPDLFAVFYPFDDLTCWQATAKGALHKTILEKHINKRGLHEWSGPYMEYEPPEEGAVYKIGADSAGWGIRDHASFQVIKVYAGEWTQVACFADDSCDPVQFTSKLLEVAERYNMAEIIVESNGVGSGPLSLLIAHGYRNLYYEAEGKPGKAATGKSVDEMLGFLAEALRDELVLNDKDTVSQLSSYRNDKRVEDGAVAEMLRGKIGRGRRERHHWDKVSALQMALVGAREGRQPVKPRVIFPQNVIPFTQLPYNEQEKYYAQLDKDKAKREGKKKLRYRPVRRRR